MTWCNASAWLMLEPLLVNGHTSACLCSLVKRYVASSVILLIHTLFLALRCVEACRYLWYRCRNRTPAAAEMCRRLDALVAKPWVDGQGRRIVTDATMDATESQKRIIMSGRVEGMFVAQLLLHMFAWKMLLTVSQHHSSFTSSVLCAVCLCMQTTQSSALLLMIAMLYCAVV